MSTEDIELKLLDGAVRIEEVEAEQVEAHIDAEAEARAVEAARALGHLATPEAEDVGTPGVEPVEKIRVVRWAPPVSKKK